MRQIFKVLVSIAVLAAMCGCDRGQEQVENVPVTPGRITLAATSEQMRSDGLDMVEFTVSVTDSEGAVHDVTEYAEIYLDLQKTPLQSLPTRMGTISFMPYMVFLFQMSLSSLHSTICPNFLPIRRKTMSPSATGCFLSSTPVLHA